MKHLYFTLLAVPVLSLNLIGQINAPEVNGVPTQPQANQACIAGLPTSVKVSMTRNN